MATLKEIRSRVEELKVVLRLARESGSDTASSGPSLVPAMVTLLSLAGSARTQQLRCAGALAIHPVYDGMAHELQPGWDASFSIWTQFIPGIAERAGK